MPSPKTGGDEGFDRFDFRTGVHGFPDWKGVCKEGSDAFPDGNQLVDCKNIRPAITGYKCRGGQDKASTQATSDVDGIWDAGDIGA